MFLLGYARLYGQARGEGLCQFTRGVSGTDYDENYYHADLLDPLKTVISLSGSISDQATTDLDSYAVPYVPVASERMSYCL